MAISQHSRKRLWRAIALIGMCLAFLSYRMMKPRFALERHSEISAIAPVPFSIVVVTTPSIDGVIVDFKYDKGKLKEFETTLSLEIRGGQKVHDSIWDYFRW